MSKHRNLQIILQVLDVGDENVETQPDLKSESPSYVRMIQLQRFIQSQRLPRPSQSYSCVTRQSQSPMYHRRNGMVFQLSRQLLNLMVWLHTDMTSELFSTNDITVYPPGPLCQFDNRAGCHVSKENTFEYSLKIHYYY